MSMDVSAGETSLDHRGVSRGVFVQALLWSAFVLFAVTLALEWTVIFFPVFDLPSPYADVFVAFRSFRLAVLDALTFVLPEKAIEYVGVVFSLGGLCVALMMIATRQSMTANGEMASDTDSGFGVLTLVQVLIGIVVVVVLWMVSTELTNDGLESGTWTPAAIIAALTAGLMLAAWFAGFVRIGPVRVNPLRWIVAALAVSHGMTWL